MKRHFALALLAVSFATANAATFTVTNTNNGGAGSLRQAVLDANASGVANTINFAVSGAIVLTSGAILIASPLSIVGPGADSLAVDGNASSQIFVIVDSNPPACPALTGPNDFPVSISGLTLRNAKGNLANIPGGAIISLKSLALNSVVIRDSAAIDGGGVGFFVQYPGQSLTIANSQFINNVAKPTAAGPGNSGGALPAGDRCTGARIPATMTIDGSVFSGNQVKPAGDVSGKGGQGGAIFLDFSGPVVIQDTRIVDNHADSSPLSADFGYDSGGIGGYATSLTIRRSEIAQNSADFGGGIGAINLDSDLQGAASAMQLTIVDSTVSGNIAHQTVGAILVGGNVAATVANSTVAGNVADFLNNDGPRISGIGAFTDVTDPPSGSNATPPTLQLVSSIVAGGQSSSPDLAATQLPLPFSVTASNSLVQFADPSVVLAGSGNRVGVRALLKPLAFNGGPTRTQGLLPGSPAIDAGSNTLSLSTDQRGPGFARVVGPATDMGAYEFATPVLGKTDFNGDHNTDIFWQSTSGGSWLFFMNGANVVNGVPAPAVAPGWALAGIGDFDGDGHADLLWRNTADATQYWIFLMNGAGGVIGGGPLLVAPGYVPTQIADFDGDGKADILWESASGGRWIYFMNGASVVSGQPLPAAAPGWFIAGVGDFNGDGKADILWNNADLANATQYWIYLMNGASVMGGGGFMVAGGYVPTQIADFDADGKANILWENGTASRWIFFMTGATITNGLPAAVAAPGWTIAGVGDVNGDGRADLLWQNSADPTQYWIFLLNGTSVIGGGGLTVAPGYSPLLH